MVVLHAAPTPQAAQRLIPRKIVALLKQAVRRNDPRPGRADQHHAAGTRTATTLPVEHATGVAAAGLIEIIGAMTRAIDALEVELAAAFDQHDQTAIITSMPGLGPVLGARMLGELGDDPDRFAGTAPITGRRDAADQ